MRGVSTGRPGSPDLTWRGDRVVRWWASWGPAIALALVIGAFLLWFVAVDPPIGVASGTSPFTDEAWNVVNARNFVLFGRFSTDDWNLHLVNTLFSGLQAIDFSLLGVGIVQARLVDILATSLTVLALGLGLRPIVGRGPALLAAAGFGCSALVLYYGRLAFLEPVVTLGLTVGALLAIRADARRSLAVGVVGGVALAAAVGVKPSAFFAACGILAGVAVVGWRDRAVRRWLGGAVTAIVIAGLVWVAVVWLPNRAAVAIDLKIWASEPLPRNLTELAHRVLSYPFRSDAAIPLGLPLLVGSLVGLAGLVSLRSHVDARQRRLAALALAWIVVGMGILLVSRYRPDRYTVPMLPAAAILTGLGAEALGRTPVWSARSATVRRLLAAGAVVGMTGPGLLAFGGWMARTPSTLPHTQAEVAAAVPGGSAIQGTYAATLGLRADAVVLVSRSVGVNRGDLYVTRDVRWVVARPGVTADRPAWAAAHAEAWAAREEVLCTDWAGSPVCLYRLP